MELNGKPVDGAFENATNLDTMETFLTVTFRDDVVVNIGDVVTHHAYGRRKVVQIAPGSGRTSYRLSEPIDG